MNKFRSHSTPVAPAISLICCHRNCLRFLLETWGDYWLLTPAQIKRQSRTFPRAPRRRSASTRWDAHLDRSGRAVHGKLKRRLQIKPDGEGRTWWPSLPPPPPPRKKKGPQPNILLHLGLLKWLLREHRKQLRAGEFQHNSESRASHAEQHSSIDGGCLLHLFLSAYLKAFSSIKKNKNKKKKNKSMVSV